MFTSTGLWHNCQSRVVAVRAETPNNRALHTHTEAQKQAAPPTRWVEKDFEPYQARISRYPAASLTPRGPFL